MVDAQFRGRRTLADVADAAGVSKMTASRALRGTGDVSPETLKKVRLAAQQIGYVGNPLAASLSGKRSGLIGVVVPSVSNIVFAEVLAGIADGLDGSGLQPVFGVTDYDETREAELIQSMLAWHPAALIVAGLDQPDATRNLLQRADIPIVQIMDTDGDPVDVCIGFSHRDAGREMAGALLARGARRMAYIGSSHALDTRARKRFAGFETRLNEAAQTFFDIQFVDGPSTATVGRGLTEQVLSDDPAIDAIYYSNDDLAIGGAYHCIAHGLSVGQDIHLAGFNGLEITKTLPVGLATTLTPRRQIGSKSVEMALAGLQKNAPLGPKRVTLQTQLLLPD